MDAKALAKSKRAHSLHHSKKHHLSSTSKGPTGSATASNAKKPNSKPEKQKASQSQGSRALPSNWDRYEEENDSGSEDLPHTSTSQAPDVMVPKSRGADYAHLISEAKAESQSYRSAEGFTLFNDILDEFNQGFGSLLSARGQQMVSWSSDDNFLLDDKESSGRELQASFLSLNLHFLAEQLEKTNIAERLFIEPDLFPQELCTGLQAEVGNPDEAQSASCTKATKGVLDGVASSSIHQSYDYVSSNSQKTGRSSSPTTSDASFLDHAADSLWHFDEAGQSTSVKLSSNPSVHPVTERQQRFDAGAAEAELDLLLDSLSDNKFFGPGERELSSHTSYVPQGSSIQSASVSKLDVKEDDTKNSQIGVANLDDDIDDLLNETANIINMKRKSPMYEPKSTSVDAPSAPRPDSKSKVLDEPKSTSVDAPSAPRPDSKSKVLDDFDSWLDTI